MLIAECIKWPRRALLALALFVAPARLLAGDLSVVGTSDGLEVMRAIGLAYSSANPDLRVLMPPGIGSSGAIVAIGAEREMIGRISRPLSRNELESGLAYRPVARLPVAVVVHPGVKVNDLSSLQLADLLSGRLTNWKVLGGTELRVRIVRRNEGDAATLALRDAFPALNTMSISERSKQVIGAQEVAAAVRINEGAIGILPYSEALQGHLNVLSIDGVSVKNPSYPAQIVLGLVFKPSRLDADMRRFLDFASGPQAAATITRLGGQVVTP